MMARVGLRPEHAQALSAHVLRRPAPAHRHRPRADAAAEARWSPTSRSRRSTSRSRRRCSICSLDLQREFGLAYLFISHDLAVVQHIAHDVLVMYLGLAVEHGPKERIFGKPLHPYTQALLASTPARRHREEASASSLKGELPSPLNPPKGCVFSYALSATSPTHAAPSGRRCGRSRAIWSRATTPNSSRAKQRNRRCFSTT